MNFFPDAIAQRIARKVGLFPVESMFRMERECPRSEKFKKALLDLDALTDFQKLSLYSDFETAMISYYGVTLSDEQIDALKMIHKSTRAWVGATCVYALCEASNR